MTYTPSMDRRPFGKTETLVPVIGQGTWQMERTQASVCVRALQRGIEAGSTHIDTAELYGEGEVETMVGKAISGRRDDVFLVSKIVPSNASKRGTIAACNRSLKRLQTDYLDCYLLHWPGNHPLGDTVGAFEELVEAGKIRSWGVSNFDVKQLEAIVDLAGPGRVACNQVLYHLNERTIEREIAEVCRTLKVSLVGYSPFGSGKFPTKSSAGWNVLETIADAHNASPRQIALAFLVREPSYFTIPMSTKVKHVKENAAAGAIQLSNREANLLADAFPLGPKRTGVPTL